ncbi:MAG: 2Fe-2S iron-sulfur cluster binding domain-containing protein, partial [Chitinivibrionales bacterium]|nr:2Fe-2S iron-sulfur cluster binding domain-containing protein [Chitinivibrionales bacterium]MBD3357944.1 2Fe-2S iron-sulfur cluster binding domain-containing protein [Chitinivibrionales bacterium]
MPRLTVHYQKAEESAERCEVVTFNAGESLKNLLSTTQMRIRTGCIGNGACGLCRVRIANPDDYPPSENERIHIDEDDLEQGIRLACGIYPRKDLEVFLFNVIADTEWSILP